MSGSEDFQPNAHVLGVKTTIFAWLANIGDVQRGFWFTFFILGCSWTPRSEAPPLYAGVFFDFEIFGETGLYLGCIFDRLFGPVDCV